MRRRVHGALAGLPPGPLALLPDTLPYAYALPGAPGRIVVSTALWSCLNAEEGEALLAHEQVHLRARHHRYLLVAQLAARAHPLLRPLRPAVAFSAERWADEEAAVVVGNRRLMARAVGKAGLIARGAPSVTLAGLAAPGPVPRRVKALLGPLPPARAWPPVATRAGLAAWTAAAGAVISALSSANAAVALFLVLHAATPL